jgi:triacylglycerol lipase
VLSRLAPARRRFVLGLLVLVGLGVLAVAAFTVNAAVRTTHTATADQGTPGPVVLVPGYGGNAGSLTPLADRLRASGRDVTVVALPDSAQGDLSLQADAVGMAVDAVLTRTGAASVDVVGYSAGGVVARLWVAEDGGASRTRRLVMLGSPLHGTDIALLGTLVSGTCPLACQQLAPGSPVLERLDRQGVPAGVVAVSVWSTTDDVIRPPTSSVLDGVPSPSLQSICPGSTVDHGGLPRDRVAQGVVLGALGAGALPAWGPGDCGRLSSVSS